MAIRLDVETYERDFGLPDLEVCFTSEYEIEKEYQMPENLIRDFDEAFGHLRSPEWELNNLYCFARGIFAQAILEGSAERKDTARTWYNSCFQRLENGFKKLYYKGLIRMVINSNERELRNTLPHWKDYNITFTLKVIKNK